MKIPNRISKLLTFTLLISTAFAQSGRDLTGTEVSAIAFRAENDPHTTVELSVNVVSPDFNFADGVRFTFDESVNILNAFVATEMDTPAAVIIADNEVLFGDSSDGVFNGDGIFYDGNEYIFVVHVDASVQVPMDIAYTVYDDGWAQDFCINDNNCEQCNDYGWGIDCDGNYLTVAMNAEGMVTVDNIDIIAAASQDPVIMDLVDVGNDQGKQMILSWHPGDLIDLPHFTEFSVYRYSPDPSDFGAVVSGAFYGEYYSSPGSGTSPDFGDLILTREDSLININFDQNPLPVNDDFQVRWTGDIYAPVSGNYNFRTHSDDGVRLFIDGELVIDQWYDFPPTSYYGSIDLDAGQHSLVLEYYENDGGAECNLFWTPPGSEESLVPPVGTGITVSDLGTWDYLSTVPWHGHDPYAKLVNTLEDKVPTAFRVTAHTDDQNVFFHSDPVIGRSYDNIAPPPPSGLVAVVTDTIVSLSWNPSDAEDFNYYSVHRAPDSNFQPNLSNFIGYSASPMFTDHSAPWNVSLFYKVSATDMGGNLGPGSGSASAFIFVNRAPQVFDVAISPAVPLVGDDINVSYTFFDPDGDQESGTVFEWYNGGTLVPQHTGSTLPGAFTGCSDEWHVVVTPSDGSLLGQPIGSNNVIVCGANTAPVWTDPVADIHIAEDTYDNIFEMGNLVSDAEQATSQLVFSVSGNTNETAIAASFDGSKLVLSAISENYNSSPAATLTLRVDDGSEISDAFVDVSIDSVNDSPAVTEYVGRNDFDEDESYLFEIYDFVIEDPDNDAVDMVMSVLPGENYDRSLDSPGLVTTAPNFNGNITVHIEITDGSGGATVTMVSMAVNPINDPAFLITTGLNIINNGPATEEEEYNLTISWKDPDGTEDASVYDVALGGPASNWLGVTNIYSSGNGTDLQYNAILVGTTDDINLPENDISISVVDNSEGQEESFIEYFYIATVPVNDAPVVESYTGPVALEEDGGLTFSADKFVVVDPDNSPIDFSVTANAGDNYTVGSDSVSIFPTQDYNGAISVVVSVSDGEKSDDVEVSLTVTPVNDALVLSEVVDGTATEESSFSTSVSWTDIDGAGADAYSVGLDGAADTWLDPSGVTHDTESGVYSVSVSGTPDDENLYQNDLSVTVTDNSEGDPISLTAYMSVDVLPVNDAPSVTGYVAAAYVNEDEVFTVSINDFVVEDVDNDFPFDFDFYIVSGDNYTVSSDNQSVTPAENFNGELPVNFMISDGSVDVPFVFVFEVLPVNDDPVLNSYVGSTSFDEDTELTLTGEDFSVSDPDVSSSGSLIFDGVNDHVEIAHSPSLEISQNITLSARVKVSEFGQWDGIITKGVNKSPYALQLWSGGRIRFTANWGSPSGYSGSGSWNSTETLSTNEWHHIAVTYDGATIKFYIDGEYSNMENVSGLVFGNENENLGFGADWPGGNEFFDGAMDDVSVWNVALTEEQIQSYLNNGLSGNESGLAGYWDFNEGSGDIVYDKSGNNNDGSINGAVREGQTPYTVHIDQNQNYSVSMDGSTIIPDENYNGPLTVNASVSDPEGGYSNSLSFDLNVDPVNDAPAVEDLAISPAVPDFGDNLVVTYAFTDIDGGTESGTVIQWYKNGELQSTETSSTVSFNSTACDEVWYALITPSDGTDQGSSYASNSVTICGENTPPEWTWSGPVRLDEDSTKVVDLYSNMIDNEQAPSQVSYTILSQASPSLVNATIDGHELFLSAATPDFAGAYVDTLTLKADDGGYQDTADVVISIVPVNDAPVASDDSYSIDEGGAIVGDADEGFLVNDTDVDGDALQIEIVEQPSNGVVQVNTDLSFSYAHDGSETTSDAFTYMAYDGEYYSNEATVSIAISPVNDSPVITYAATFETDEETPFDVVVGDFIIEDSDTDIGSISIQISDGENYTAATIADGYTITPAANFSGGLVVPVIAFDGDSSSAVWDLFVEVIGGNDAPVVANAENDISVDEDAEGISISLLGSETAPYFSDSDGDNLSFAAHTAGSGLVAAMIDGDTLHISFIENAFGSDSLFVSAIDVIGESASDTILVSVASVNDAPVILAAAYFVTDEEDSVHVGINDFVYNDVDNDDSELTLVLSDGDGYSLEPITGGYAVTPDPDVSDTLYVPSVISDGDTTSAVWDLMVIVQPDNDAPVVVNPAADISVDEDADDIVIALMGSETEPYFADGDGDSLDFMVSVEGSPVTSAMVDVDILHISFTENMSGTNTIVITATDPSGDSAADTILVTVNAVNDPPLIVDAISFQTYEDDSLDISIYDFVIRDEDTWDEDAFSITISDNENYELSPTEEGYRAVPLPNFFGDIPMAVTASDGEAVSDTFFTVLSVIPVNDIPEIVNPLADINVDEDADTMMISLSGTETVPYFVDVDGDSIEFDVHVSGSDIFHLMVDGHDIEISFMENMHGSDTIYVSGTDGSGAFALDTIVVTVSSVNDIPTAFSLLSPEDSTEVIITQASVLQNVTIDVAWSPSSDADGDTVGYGFVLFSGPYSVSTPALYTVDVPITALSIPHSAAAALLEAAGYQSITCDWMVFATDGQDTTASTEIRTITIDARPVLSTDELAMPEVFALHQNYPNPFNPSTRIKYDLPEAQNVQIMIYDIMGRKVRTLINEYQDIGYRTIRWDATDDFGRAVSAGMYVYTIQAGDFRQVKKMVLLK